MGGQWVGEANKLDAWSNPDSDFRQRSNMPLSQETAGDCEHETAVAPVRDAIVPLAQNKVERSLRSRVEPRNYEIRNHAGPSVIWKSFGIVYDTATGAKTNFAACKTCSKTFIFKTGGKGIHSTGTSTIVSAQQKAKMTAAAVDYCASDMRVFESVSGVGFKAVIQAALDIGVASNGRVVVNDLLPCPLTVRRNVEARAVSGREALSIILHDHLVSDVGFATTIDMWTDTVKKTSYLSITSHYVNADMVLHARTLHVKPVFDASHTAVVVKNELKSGLAVLEIGQAFYDQIIVVSDSGSNCRGAEGIPSEFAWLACLDHKLATVLTTVFNKTTTMINGVKSAPFYKYNNEQHANLAVLFNVFDANKKLVEYFKRTNLQCMLSKTLNVHDMTDEVIELLKKRNKLDLFNFSQDLLAEIVSFLDVFQLATLSLEQFKSPTLHKHLMPVMHNVLDDGGNLVRKADSASLIAAKGVLMPIFIEKFVVRMCMSRRRSCAQCSSAVFLVEVIKMQLKCDMAKYGHQLDTEVDAAVAPPVSKKARVGNGHSMYDMEEDEDERSDDRANSNFSNRIDIEFKSYNQHTISDNEKRDSEVGGEFNVLAWWKTTGAKLFPIMACVARSILCVPASSAMSENNFSDVGNTLTKKRNRLKPRVVNDLMFVRSNRDLCKK
ncbi:hypothetical protein Mp_7g09770 [Marchantia polymorpha subsp. ruderalis]|uniref:HAT C-terminal dimerisation domain-containing protein n=2 Tax=Marchantia polymorpha TaxID=3197 RepID=A0AAF6BXW2_MARPO|nr:hypothetical protein MARPO_0156s0004 [Marchantia polymorpha]BBN16846.1 hypothetical protein Mp_7g09770 [Marchantia polymorpha subsp. ruderalis]|eukprot:PTQ28701.1 hypothetical protein MARPO_0156s0004 [Marchantia polymorpha]